MNEFEDLRSQLSIIELAELKGYALDRQGGMKTPVFRNRNFDDKIIIVNPNSASNQGYWNPHDDNDKGHIYHFIKNRLNSVFAQDIAIDKSEHENILSVLRKYARAGISLADTQSRSSALQTIRQYQPKEFLVPILDTLRDTKYLESRGIRAETYNADIFKDRIFNRRSPYYNNTVFPLLNANSDIVGLDERYTGGKFLTAGSDKAAGVWMSKPPEEKTGNILLFESPIDALSFYQLKEASIPSNALFISFCGSIAEGQLNTVKQIISQEREKSVERNDKINIIIGTDNDAAGNRYADKIKAFFADDNSYTFYRAKPANKDFNEDLQPAKASEFSEKKL